MLIVYFYITLLNYRNLAIGKDSKCFIELSTPKLTQDEIQAIEDRCNECIRQHRAMTPRWLDPSSEELEEVLSVFIFCFMISL